MILKLSKDINIYALLLYSELRFPGNLLNLNVQHLLKEEHILQIFRRLQ